MVKRIGIMAGMLMILTAVGFGQATGSLEKKTAWELSYVNGYFTGGDLGHARVQGETVKAESDGGWLTGLRFGVDGEFLGAEMTAAGVFADMNLKADQAAFDADPSLKSAKDARYFLANLNALWFPAGNYFAEGRVRPFFTAGPGLAYFNSDFDQIDNETMFDWNVGLGIKFLLGDEGNPTLRVDYRWYQILGAGNMKDDMFHQEISVGIGIRF